MLILKFTEVALVLPKLDLQYLKKCAARSVD